MVQKRTILSRPYTKRCKKIENHIKMKRTENTLCIYPNEINKIDETIRNRKVIQINVIKKSKRVTISVVTENFYRNFYRLRGMET